MARGRLNITKTLRVLPGIRLRYSLLGGVRLVLGVSGVTYTIPLRAEKRATERRAGNNK